MAGKDTNLLKLLTKCEIKKEEKQNDESQWITITDIAY